MIRGTCPNCNQTVESPNEAAGTVVPCPGCGQPVRLAEAAPRAAAGEDPILLEEATEAHVSAEPLPPGGAAPRYRDEGEGRYERRARRGDYPDIRLPSASLRGLATAGMVCGIGGLGGMLADILLWAVVLTSAPFWGHSTGLVVTGFVVLFVSFVLSLLGVIFGARGMSIRNYDNRGSGIAGMVVGIIGLVLACLVGFFACAGWVAAVNRRNS